MARPKQVVNIMRIAREAGISHMTVSRVLNNRDDVSEATRERVLALQKKYHFKQSSPKGIRNEKIAIVVHDLASDPYEQRIVKGVMDFNNDNRFDITLTFAGQGANPFRNLRGLQCSGLIMPAGDIYRDRTDELLKLKMPVVLLDYIPDNSLLGGIDNDSYSGSVALAKHLLSLGHRKIAYLAHGLELKGDHKARLQGYLDTMHEAGFQAASELVMAVNEVELETGLGHWDNVPVALDRLLKRAPCTTAIMCADDNLAFHAMKALRSFRLNVPDDISITGFDNQSVAALWNPELTTVDHQIERAGRLAAEAIAYAIDHPGAWDLPHITLPVKLMIRNSTAKPRKD